jgi:hypothetical protein
MAITRVAFEAFRENSHFLKTMPVWLPSANNEWNFIWTTNYFHGSISAYVPDTEFREIPYLEIYLDFCKLCHSGRSWPLMKGTLLCEQSTFTSVGRLPFQVFTWNSKPSTETCVVRLQYHEND